MEAQDLLGPDFGLYHLQPYLEKTREIPNLTANELTYKKGLQLIAEPKKGVISYPAVLTVFFKTSMFFAQHPIVTLPQEKWLLLQATLAGGFGSKIQVQGRTKEQIKAFMDVLARNERYAVLQGQETQASNEFISVSRISGENFLFLTMHVVLPNYSTSEISFFVSYPVADVLANYLRETGFAA
jgi:hypothetical protein